ncbi:18353_t:CDS:2 [Funneliformis geosporum]|uniref:5336_t:CDS:1 n=1 Tax=Funneliformis geosporum TaxID=1117311 RepID=A0A9W4WUK5_9GLOM|nr:18353_t:CDS:2 [Funneliformis geosporum]CAI2173250.1 5336_t:CDS:2 [Funneliformis geosporum]
MTITFLGKKDCSAILSSGQIKHKIPKIKILIQSLVNDTDEFRPDVSGWKPKIKQRFEPIIHSSPLPLLWIEVVYVATQDQPIPDVAYGATQDQSITDVGRASISSLCGDS